MAELVRHVVGQLDDADAQAREGRHAIRIVTHHGRVLETIDDADPSRPVCLQDIVRRKDLQKVLRIRVNPGIHVGDVVDALLEGLGGAGDVAESHVDGRYARNLQVRQYARIDLSRIRAVACLFRRIAVRVGIVDAAQRIDDDAA